MISLQHLPDGVFAVGVPELFEVVGDVVGGEGAVAHDEVVRLEFCDFGDGGFVDVFIEAGDEFLVVYEEDFLAVDFTFLDFAGKFKVAFEHDLEQQIHRGAVAFDVGIEFVEEALVDVGGFVIHIVHVAFGKFQDTKTAVRV